MRYYAIVVGNSIQTSSLSDLNGVTVSGTIGPFGIQTPPTGISPISGAAQSGAQWCSVVNGQNDPGALDIEFDIQLNPGGGLFDGWIKIYGIPQNIISQSSNFTNLQVQLFGGFIPGLPLATLEAPHAGLICEAQIWPCIGNWTGNELSLSFILNISTGNSGGPTAPINIIHNMPKGTQLSAAIQQALSTAFQGLTVNTNISSNLVLPYDDHGYYQSFEQYMNYVKTLSHSILGTPQKGGYYGVRFDPMKGPINVFDGTAPQGTISLLFEDLIGQPTWVGQNEIQIKCALRSDIQCNNKVQLPPNILVNTTGGTSPSFSGTGAVNFIDSSFNQIQHGDVLIFNGTFTVIAIRHCGRFRNPNAESNWVTIINALIDTGSGVSPAIINQSGFQQFGPFGGGIA